MVGENEQVRQELIQTYGSRVGQNYYTIYVNEQRLARKDLTQKERKNYQAELAGARQSARAENRIFSSRERRTVISSGVSAVNPTPNEVQANASLIGGSSRERPRPETGIASIQGNQQRTLTSRGRVIQSQPFSSPNISPRTPASSIGGQSQIEVSRQQLNQERTQRIQSSIQRSTPETQEALMLGRQRFEERNTIIPTLERIEKRISPITGLVVTPAGRFIQEQEQQTLRESVSSDIGTRAVGLGRGLVFGAASVPVGLAFALGNPATTVRGVKGLAKEGFSDPIGTVKKLGKEQKDIFFDNPAFFAGSLVGQEILFGSAGKVKEKGLINKSKDVIKGAKSVVNSSPSQVLSRVVGFGEDISNKRVPRFEGFVQKGVSPLESFSNKKTRLVSPNTKVIAFSEVIKGTKEAGRGVIRAAEAVVLAAPRALERVSNEKLVFKKGTLSQQLLSPIRTKTRDVSSMQRIQANILREDILKSQADFKERNRLAIIELEREPDYRFTAPTSQVKTLSGIIQEERTRAKVRPPLEESIVGILKSSKKTPKSPFRTSKPSVSSMQKLQSSILREDILKEQSAFKEKTRTAIIKIESGEANKSIFHEPSQLFTLNEIISIERNKLKVKRPLEELIGERFSFRKKAGDPIIPKKAPPSKEGFRIGRLKEGILQESKRDAFPGITQRKKTKLLENLFREVGEKSKGIAEQTRQKRLTESFGFLKRVEKDLIQPNEINNLLTGLEKESSKPVFIPKPLPAKKSLSSVFQEREANLNKVLGEQGGSTLQQGRSQLIQLTKPKQATRIKTVSQIISPEPFSPTESIVSTELPRAIRKKSFPLLLSKEKEELQLSSRKSFRTPASELFLSPVGLTSTRTRSRTSTAVTQGLSSRQDQRLRFSFSPTQAFQSRQETQSIQASAAILAFQPVQAVRTKQAQKQEQQQLFRTRTRTRTQLDTITGRRRRTQEDNFNFVPRQRQEGFLPVLFKSGKPVRALSTTPLTRSDALAVGANFVDQTIKASFKLVQRGSATPRGIKGPTGILREGKRDPSLFVEKNQFRISTRGEKASLSLGKQLRQKTRRLFT